MADIVTIDGHTKVICDICHNAMKISKNDSELFLCYQCNTRTFKSQLKVEQVIVPKREQKQISYKDDFIDSAFAIASDTASGIDDMPNRLSDVKEWDALHSALLEDTEEHKKIKEGFKKVLPDSVKMKIDFKENT